MSLDPRFERTVLAEFALRERRARQRSVRRDRSSAARALAEFLHRERHELLAHLARVAFSVPARHRRVAWLHRPEQANVTWTALADRLDGARPHGDLLSALVLLPDPHAGR